MNPFNSAIRTEYSTGTRVQQPGNYVFLGDYRICRYDPHDGILYFKGQIMKNIEYAVRVEDFLKAVESLPTNVAFPAVSYPRPEPRPLFKETKY